MDFGISTVSPNLVFPHPKSYHRIRTSSAAIKEYVHSRRRKHITTALDSVSLDALKGEITIILGTNGAGKSTLMSIIAGMTSKTQGTVYVNGLDTSTRLGEIRRDLCLCPQTDHTFKYLTVKENVTFFLRLKKRVKNEKNSAEYLLAKLNIVKKANYYSHQLSSGMRRCLQLACALVGDADVLVLDEPTSGMDLLTMHTVWDILMNLRGPKTIIMTTMIMEEADALADRIALLHNGKLKCYGSPSFLKEALGNQVNLDIELQPKNRFTDVNKIVMEQVPEASFVQMDNNIVTYRMSSKAKEKLPALFDKLEASQKELGITTMEIRMSMEEIFLRFIQGDEDNLVFYTDETEETEDFRLHGWRLWRNQLRILTKRTYVFFWTKKLQFIILQIVVPLLAITLITLSANSSFGYGGHISAPDYEVIMFMVYNMGPFTRSHLFDGKHFSFLKDIKPMRSNDVRKDVNRLVNYHEHYQDADAVFGYSMEKNRSIIFHAGHSYPLVTRAINAFSNIFKTIHIPYASNSSIVTTYQPIHMRADKLKTILYPKTFILCLTWAIWTAFFAALPLVPFILFPIKEFHNGARYNFLLSGCSPVLIWSSKLLAHFSIYLLVIVPCIITIVICFEFDKTLDELEFLISIFLILTLFGLAFLIQLYVLSYFLNLDHAVSQMYIASLALGLVAPIFLHYIANIEDNPAFAVLLIMFLCPSVTFSVGLVMTTLKARSNAYCKLNRHLCPNDLINDVDFSKDICCKSSATNPFEYFKLEWKFSTTFAIILLLLHITVNYALLILLQNRVLQNIGEKISHLRYTVPRQLYNDKKVNKEMKDVKDKMSLLKTKKFKDRIPLLENNSLIVDNLHKHYTAFCGDSFKAVKGISFAVKKGECLGVLGPNGAGKTTALKMVAGFTVMTRGDSNVSGYFLRKERHKYLNNIAFAREDGGLDYFLTGYESLALISNLYGRPEYLTKKLVLRVLGFMGLQVYSEMKIKSYSVGCCRRLAVCVTLLANPPAGLFDEPTVGVDPYTKPLVVRAIKHIRKMGTACVVAEASMDWRLMDSICSRIAIMCHGQVAAIGTATEIRTEFGSGYVATIKLRPNTAFTIRDEDTVKVFRRSVSVNLQNLQGSPTITSARGFNNTKGVMCIKSATPTDSVIDLKIEFEDMFETSTLREEHLTMLYYHIEADGELPYSEIFTKLEILKNKYDDVVEDYTLSPASIEDVFRKLENLLADKG